jgi:CheY-like chemotaxis protein
MVIDDDPLVLKTVGKLLEIQGYYVTTCESGEEALSIIEQEEIDLVITDIRMPHMDGVETINVMIERCEKNNKDAPPFIFITGYADEEINQKAQDLDPADFIVKPFNQIDFVESVKSALGV